MIPTVLTAVVRTFRSACLPLQTARHGRTEGLHYVAALLCAGLLTVTTTAQRAGQSATLVIVNGKVLNADGTFSEAVAIAGAQILRVGSTRDISDLQSSATRVI